MLLKFSSCTLSDIVKNIGSEDFTLWNKVVTKRFFQSSVGRGDFSATMEDGRITYVFVYQPPASNPNYLLSAAVEVRSAGTLLNRTEHERIVATTPLDERVRRFPSVGSRSQTTAPFFGPGGTSFGLLSTTNDERFDINVNILKNGAEGNVATLDALEVSSRLHQAYDSLTAVPEQQ